MFDLTFAQLREENSKFIRKGGGGRNQSLVRIYSPEVHVGISKVRYSILFYERQLRVPYFFGLRGPISNAA